MEIRIRGSLTNIQRVKILKLLERESFYNADFAGLDLTTKLVENCEFTEIEHADEPATTQLLHKILDIIDNN